MRVLLILRSEKSLVSGDIFVVRRIILADREILLYEKNRIKEGVDFLNRRMILRSDTSVGREF